MMTRPRSMPLVCLLALLAACGDDDPRRAATPTSTATPPSATPTPTSNPLAQACRDSGGTVSSASCCLGTTDFPSSCGIGACGCAPSASHEVARCDCPSGTCWNGSTCAAPATATPTPNPLAASCRDAGGTVATRPCCASVADFSDTCGPPRSCDECLPSPDTRLVSFCECPTAGDCWNGTGCVPDLAL